MEFYESDSFYDDWKDWEDEQDPYYDMGFCPYPNCIMHGTHHFESECHNADDLQRYYDGLQQEV